MRLADKMRLMKRLPVDSSCIASIGYEPPECELDIEFRAGREVYRYFEVPPEEHAAFMAAESKGRYLNEVFKPKGHRYDIVQPGEEADVTSEGE